MRVDLRRHQVFVAQHCLNGAKVRTSLQEIRREGVPEHVGGDPLSGDPRLSRNAADSLEEILTRHGPPPSGQEQRLDLS